MLLSFRQRNYNCTVYTRAYNTIYNTTFDNNNNKVDGLACSKTAAVKSSLPRTGHSVRHCVRCARDIVAQYLAHGPRSGYDIFSSSFSASSSSLRSPGLPSSCCCVHTLLGHDYTLQVITYARVKSDTIPYRDLLPPSPKWIRREKISQRRRRRWRSLSSFPFFLFYFIFFVLRSFFASFAYSSAFSAFSLSLFPSILPIRPSCTLVRTHNIRARFRSSAIPSIRSYRALGWGIWVFNS